MKTRKLMPVIINCDTGIDDAVALMMAVKSEKLDIRLIVTDNGNIEPKKAAKNTQNILELVDAPKIDVAAGDGKCFKKDRPRVSVHGTTGMGEYSFEPNDRETLKVDAVEAMNNALKRSSEKITIICISPTSNLAKLIERHPENLNKIERVVVMAGTVEEMRAFDIPYAEFNVSSDPEAGETLFNSKLQIDVVPMEMGHNAYLTWQEVFKTKLCNFTGSVLETIFRSYKDRHVKNGIATHDGCAIAYVIAPEIFKVKPVFASVKYFNEINSGILTMDFEKTPNAKACVDMNIKKFKKLYFKLLKKCK